MEGATAGAKAPRRDSRSDAPEGVARAVGVSAAVGVSTTIDVAASTTATGADARPEGEKIDRRWRTASRAAARVVDTGSSWVAATWPQACRPPTMTSMRAKAAAKGRARTQTDVSGNASGPASLELPGCSGTLSVVGRHGASGQSTGGCSAMPCLPFLPVPLTNRQRACRPLCYGSRQRIRRCGRFVVHFAPVGAVASARHESRRDACLGWRISCCRW